MILFSLATSRSGRSKLKTHKNKSHSKAKAHLRTTYWVRPLIKTAQSYHSFANIAYCPGDVINQLSCPLCSDIVDNSFEVFKFKKHKVGHHVFTWVILYSTTRNEVVISFSGPRNASPVFYSSVHSRGFEDKGNGISIERTYSEIYEGKFKTKLEKALVDYMSKFSALDNQHKYVFVGHSFGGSLATLAAYDLVTRNVIIPNAELSSPIVYSYGALRIGNAAFVDSINSLFKVVRIIKANDVYPRIPSCTWSASLNKFRCEEEDEIVQLGNNNRPELLNYIQNYYGKQGGLRAGIEAPFSGNRMTFIEKSSQVGWSYSQNSPGYMINNGGDPFDSYGRKSSDDGRVSYSQPLGAEVLFSSNFRKHTICSYYYGIPNCERGAMDASDTTAGKSYFDADLTDC